MGIVNIHILNQPGVSNVLQQAQVTIAAIRITEHRHGQHTWGNMRRDCPLCQGR